MPKLLLATGNPAKVREYYLLLQDVSFQLTTLAEERIHAEVAETGDTLEANAQLKATAYAAESHLLTLADDSGLEVDVLGGAPGSLSARYAGEGASDRERIEFLLSQLKDVPWENRSARFRCVIAIASPSGRVELCEGECQGIITSEPRGDQGFGYDPIFFLPKLGRTMAELTLREKNELSHRGKAAQKACLLLKKWYNEIT
jgi:XTP/dITP diphosphohydrolase